MSEVVVTNITTGNKFRMMTSIPATLWWLAFFL